MNLFSIGKTISDKPARKTAKKLVPIIKAKMTPRGVVYGSVGMTASRTTFAKSEYNLGEVSKVIDVEAYVRQAFGKHTELCLKEGYEISSRNEEATMYVKRRLREMADVSGITFEMLLRGAIQNIVAYSNSFIVKARDIKRSSGKPVMRVDGIPLPPVSAYFALDPTSILIKRDRHGKVLKYQQKVPGNPESPEFKAYDVVHMYYDRKEGFAFGTPYIIPVLDDIRSLRRMEENVEMLVNQHLFPLYQYQVGSDDSPAEIYEDGSTEVDRVKDQIELMPTEGSIVTPERHTITNLGAEGKALDAKDYLEYFEKRVIAGLGMSEIALGRGGTANRSTASTIDKMMQDRCKDYQDVTETFINEFIMKELLYEGGFAIDETEDNFVKLKFNEIDIDNMLKVENHSVFKYEHDAITETELRELLGKDPVAEEQREDMYFERISKPKAIIMAVDEPYTAEAKGGAVAKISKEEKKKKETANKEKPTNQHGTKPAKTRQKKDSNAIAALLDHHWHLTKLDVIDLIKDTNVLSDFEIEKIKPIVMITYDDIKRKAYGHRIDSEALDNGVKDIFLDMGDCLCDTVRSIHSDGEITYKVNGVFESFRGRLRELANSVVL